MAKRRAIAQGLSAASDTLGLMIRQILQQQSAEKEIAAREESQRRLQTEDDERQRQQALYQSGLRREEGDLGDKRARGLYEFEHKSQFDPSAGGADLIGRVIGGAKSPAELPADEVLSNQFNLQFGDKGAGVLPSILAAAAKQRQQLSGLQKRWDPTTQTETQTLPGEGKVRLGPTPEEKGQNTQTEMLKGTLSRPVMNAEAQKAGLVSGAQARAQAAVEFDPQIVAKRIDQAGRMAKAQAIAKNDADALVDTKNASDAGVTVATALQQIDSLYNKVKSSSILGTGMRMGRAFASKTGLGQVSSAIMSPDATLLDSTVEGTASTFYTLFGGKGNASNTDLEVIRNLFPYSYTDAAVGDPKLANLKMLVGFGPLAAGLMKGQSTANKIAAAKRWVILTDQAKPDADTIYDPELGIEIPNFKKVSK